MARRKNYTAPVVLTLTAAIIAGGVVGVYKLLASDAGEPIAEAKTGQPVASSEATPPKQLAAVTTVVPATRPAAAGQVEHKPAPVQLSQSVPATKPAAAKADVNADVAAALAEAETKQKAEDFLGARRALMKAFNSTKITPAQKADVAAKLTAVSEVIVFSPRKFISDEYATQHLVQPGERLQSIANKFETTYPLICRINGIPDPSRMRAGKSLKIVKGPFHAVVSKSNFTLDVYLGKPGTENAVMVKRLRVGLGENDSTPTGEWKITDKVVNPTYYNPRDDGPRIIAADDPKNPLGERWIALEGVAGQAVGKASYGIHGTIEPDSIGKRQSLGCIRLADGDIELVYELLIKDKSSVTVED